MEVWRTTGCRHFLRGPRGTTGSTSTRTRTRKETEIRVFSGTRYEVFRGNPKVIDQISIKTPNPKCP